MAPSRISSRFDGLSQIKGQLVGPKNSQFKKIRPCRIHSISNGTSS